MQLMFWVVERIENLNPYERGQIYLRISNWDDFSYKTSFEVFFANGDDQLLELGTIKIGYKGQPKGWTAAKLPPQFEALPEGYFSLGQDVNYYKCAFENLGSETRIQLLRGLRDCTFDEAIVDMAVQEKVFNYSLTRSVGLSTVRDQFRRVLEGKPDLTNYDFTYFQESTVRSAQVELSFEVIPNSKPSTNVHVLIGRNGVGKTTILNNMVRTLMGHRQGPHDPSCGFYTRKHGYVEPLPFNYFSSVISVSFSAFDSFLPPKERADRSKGPAFFYVGMKKTYLENSDPDSTGSKTTDDHFSDFQASFESCLSQPAKRTRLLEAINRLGFDSSFYNTKLPILFTIPDRRNAARLARSMARKLSSGHAIVLLTITKLVDTVDEKSLVLLDEPESHLHPPLLSAFTRALSDLLHDRNGVAIVATHSPVILQEVPKSCVWKISRNNTEGRIDRLDRETFGENVGVLTSEVFGLEVSKSGFHQLLAQSVSKGYSFDEIIGLYQGQLGTEAQAILYTLISARDATRRDTQ